MKHQIFVKTVYFFQNTSSRQDKIFFQNTTFKGGLFIWPLELQSLTPWSRVPVFVTKNGSHSFLEGYCIYFDRRTCSHPLFSNSFNSSMFITKKGWFQLCVVSEVLSIKYSQPFILSTVMFIFLTLKFEAIQFCQCTSFQHISGQQSPW